MTNEMASKDELIAFLKEQIAGLRGHLETSQAQVAALQLRCSNLESQVERGLKVIELWREASSLR